MSLVLSVDWVPVAAIWLATYLVHSTLIFGAVWLLQWRAGARVRDLLWKASLVLPLVTTTARMIAPTGGAGPSWALPRLELGNTEIARSQGMAPAPGTASVLPAWTVPSNTPVEAAPPPPAATPPVDTLGFRDLALAWGGALALLLGMARLLVPLVRIHGRLRGRRLIDTGPIYDELNRLHSSARLVRTVTAYALDGLSSPIAAGTVRPAIYLPARVAELPPAMQRSLLAHEMAHHLRFDPLWSRIAHATVATMYFQPLHRIARNRITSAAELLADDRALGWTQDAEGLASCLTEVAGWIRSDERLAPGVPMVRAAGRSALRERIERAFDRPRDASVALRWPLTLSLAATTMAWMPSLQGRPLAPFTTLEPTTRDPYLNALTPTIATLELLGAPIDALSTPDPEASALKVRWRDLQQRAEALRASIVAPSRPE